MAYLVTCPVCRLLTELDDADEVLEFQEEHRAAYGDHHVLEYALLQ